MSTVGDKPDAWLDDVLADLSVDRVSDLLILDSLDLAIIHGEIEERGYEVELQAVAACATVAEIRLLMNELEGSQNGAHR